MRPEFKREYCAEQKIQFEVDKCRKVLTDLARTAQHERVRVKKTKVASLCKKHKFAICRAHLTKLFEKDPSSSTVEFVEVQKSLYRAVGGMMFPEGSMRAETGLYLPSMMYWDPLKTLSPEKQAEGLRNPGLNLSEKWFRDPKFVEAQLPQDRPEVRAELEELGKVHGQPKALGKSTKIKVEREMDPDQGQPLLQSLLMGMYFLDGDHAAKQGPVQVCRSDKMQRNVKALKEYRTKGAKKRAKADQARGLDPMRLQATSSRPGTSSGRGTGKASQGHPAISTNRPSTSSRPQLEATYTVTSRPGTSRSRATLSRPSTAMDIPDKEDILANLHPVLLSKLQESWGAVNKAFKFLDVDRSNSVDIEEFEMLFARFNIELTYPELKKSFDVFAQGDDEISYEQFNRIVGAIIHQKDDGAFNDKFEGQVADDTFNRVYKGNRALGQQSWNNKFMQECLPVGESKAATTIQLDEDGLIEDQDIEPLIASLLRFDFEGLKGRQREMELSEGSSVNMSSIHSSNTNSPNKRQQWDVDHEQPLISSCLEGKFMREEKVNKSNKKSAWDIRPAMKRNRIMAKYAHPKMKALLAELQRRQAEAAARRESAPVNSATGSTGAGDGDDDDDSDDDDDDGRVSVASWESWGLRSCLGSSRPSTASSVSSSMSSLSSRASFESATSKRSMARSASAEPTPSKLPPVKEEGVTAIESTSAINQTANVKTPVRRRSSAAASSKGAPRTPSGALDADTLLQALRQREGPANGPSKSNSDGANEQPVPDSARSNRSGSRSATPSKGKPIHLQKLKAAPGLASSSLPVSFGGPFAPTDGKKASEFLHPKAQGAALSSRPSTAMSMGSH